MDFTSREIATGFLFVAFIALSLVLSKNKKDISQSFIDALKALGQWKVWSVLLAFLLYTATLIFIAHTLDLWDPSLLKDTIIIALFTGFPIITASFSKKSGADLVKHVVKEILGVTALLVAYLNLAPLPLWGELILQTVVVFLVLCVALGGRNPEQAAAVRFCRGLLGIIGFLLLAHTTHQVVTRFGSYDWSLELSVFALSIWLPLAYLGFVYPLAYIAACEIALLRLRMNNAQESPPWRVRFALVTGFHGSLRYATRFTMGWLPYLAAMRTYRSARRAMRGFRRAVRQAAHIKRQHRRNVKTLAGVLGVNSNGYWLDRREFDETKSVLETLSIVQMGYARNHKNRFSADPVNLLLNHQLDKLPTSHGLEPMTSKDHKSWLVWRKTAGGFYLAVGGRAADISEQWRYAGTEPPSSFPGANATEWGIFREGDCPREWQRSDRPLPDALDAPTI